jgi:aminopeptidase
MKNFEFYSDSINGPQKQLFRHFYTPLHKDVLAELGLVGGKMFAYRQTGGSNLDFLDDVVINEHGEQLSLRRDVYSIYNIILCGGKFSATAPLTAQAKIYGFRGATMHGLNSVIINSGLSVDYNEVSATAEKMRSGLTYAEFAEIDFECMGETYTLHLGLGEQDAQKSHGLCRTGPDIANLPAGEIYFVPTKETQGQYPHRYKDGTIGICHVQNGRIEQVKYVAGNVNTVKAHNALLARDPMTGELGELGLGTQDLPVSRSDIQDEKVIGTVHLATGRSDHLGGHLTPDMFADRLNATHDDDLFSPESTPEINVAQVRMMRFGKTIIIIENYQPSQYVLDLRR